MLIPCTFLGIDKKLQKSSKKIKNKICYFHFLSYHISNTIFL